MNSIGQILFMIALLISGIAYTVYNYLRGGISLTMLIMAVGLLGISLINMTRGLIRALREK